MVGMSRLMALRRRGWTVTACVAVALGLCVAPTASADPGNECGNRSNDTARKLVECVTTADLWQHMQNFQKIADANPGPDGHASRNSGEPGYKASVDYVAAAMKAAGYDVTIQPYTFDYFAFKTAVLKQVTPAPKDFAPGKDWNPGQAVGTATNAAVQAAGGIVDPPVGGSASGCTAADFAGFKPGNIALIQRGTCTFGTKALNAQNAGAPGVVIFNEGNTPGRSGLLSGSLVDAAGNPVALTIPVAFVPFATGHDLVTQAAGATPPRLSIAVDAISDPNRLDYNVIADSREGDPDHVVVVDAHLDAIFGAGMLDNASGSVTILDIAQQMRKVEPRNKLRFIWFGGEELGLLGSDFYVNSLPPAELAKIGYDLDADVMATPNYIIGVLDPAAPNFFDRSTNTAGTFPANVYQPSLLARDRAVRYFDSVGLKHEFLSPTGTDAFNFNLAGIPASGLLTGQDCCKSADEVTLFGGVTGNYEGNVPSTDGGCVDNPFRWCDNLSNNDPKVLTFMSKAFATMVVQMAFDRTVLGPGGKKPGKHAAHKEEAES
jgi:Peptidase family M28/PA domain